MKIEVVEVLGSDQFLYGTVGDDTLIARVGSYLDAEPGDRIRLGLAANRAHLFDAETQKSLLSAPYRHRRIRDAQGA
jgi:multiple sugar transport system ATP-binding protein